MATRTPILAIVGRPNVGKSTLFNRVLGKKRAVVEDIPGVTRDRNYALVEGYDFPFYLVDTGGFEQHSDDELQMLVSEQAVLAAEEADMVLAVFDGQAGSQPGDEDVVALLRRYNKPVRYVVNKCDGKEQEAFTADFYSLGIDSFSQVSALHGRGITSFVEESLRELPNYQSLIDSQKARLEREREAAERAARLEERLREQDQRVTTSGESQAEMVAEGNLAVAPEEEASPRFLPVFDPTETDASPEAYLRANRVLSLEESRSKEMPQHLDEATEWESAEEDRLQEPEFEIANIRVALIGRPNVGKSTLLNTLTGEQRAITSPIAGTTRDPLDLPLLRDGQQYVLVDTAGLRKKARIGDRVEQYSAMRSMRAITESDVAVVLLDATQGPTEQDAKIVGLAHEQGRGIVIVVNKWDIVEKNHRSVKEFKDKIAQTFKFTPYAPVLFVSALSGKRCPKILETVRRVAYSRAQRVSTVRLNRVLQNAMRRRTPPVVRGKPLKLLYASQVEISPPRILFFLNYPQSMHFSYLRFLKNAIRAEFGFEGTDIKIICRKRS